MGYPGERSCPWPCSLVIVTGVFSSTDTVLRRSVRDDRSGLPSPLKSADRHGGHGKLRWRRSAGRRRKAWSPRAPSCSAAPTRCWTLRLATTRSGLPSPLRSATATEEVAPGGEVRWAAKEGVVAPASSCSAAPTHCWRYVGDDEVGPAVAVEVGDGHGVGPEPAAKVAGWRRWALAPRHRRVQQHRHRVVELRLATTRSGLPSPLRSADRHGARPCPVAKVCLGGEGGRGRAWRRRVQQHRHRVASPTFATTRSGLPSPLRSATATEKGSIPAAKSPGRRRRRWSPRRRRVQQHRHTCSLCVLATTGRACRRR